MTKSYRSGWLERRPQPGETCVFSHGYWDSKSHTNQQVSSWKRDALLFDRVYARCVDPDHPPDIPLSLSFGILEVEEEAQQHDHHMSMMMAMAYGGAGESEVEQLVKDGYGELLDFDLQLSNLYGQAGVMGEWTYHSTGSYLRRFIEGERLAYEGALMNLPLVSTQEVSWEHILSFRKDPDAVRKYRDLRLWLRAGLNAQSAQHAGDIIGQKIENYRWAIKKHGFQTAIQGMTQLFDWKASSFSLTATGMAGAIGGPVWASIAGGMTVTAQIGAFLCEKKLASHEISRGPDSEIAILYDAQERIGNIQRASESPRKKLKSKKRHF